MRDGRAPAIVGHSALVRLPAVSSIVANRPARFGRIAAFDQIFKARQIEQLLDVDVPRNDFAQELAELLRFDFTGDVHENELVLFGDEYGHAGNNVVVARSDQDVNALVVFGYSDARLPSLLPEEPDEGGDRLHRSLFR